MVARSDGRCEVQPWPFAEAGTVPGFKVSAGGSVAACVEAQCLFDCLDGVLVAQLADGGP